MLNRTTKVTQSVLRQPQPLKLSSLVQFDRYPDLLPTYQQQEKVVVHCAGGSVCTGHILIVKSPGFSHPTP
jgi:protein-tyrosine phosphatase